MKRTGRCGAVRARPLSVKLPAAAVLVPVLVVAVARAAAAQQWSVEAQAGRLRYDAGAGDVRSSSMMVGAGYAARERWLQLFGGVPLATTDPAWGAVAAGARPSLAAGPLRVGLDLSGSAFLEQARFGSAPAQPDGGLLGPILGPPPGSAPPASSSGYGLAGQGGAFVRAGRGPVRAEVLGAVSRYHAQLGGLAGNRTVPLGEARLTLAPAPALALSVGARRYFAPEGAATLAQVSGTVAHAGHSLWGSVGTWLSAPGGTGGASWSAGGALRVTGPVQVTAEARHEPYDPLYLSLPRTAWSTGVRVRLGHAPPALKAPVPAAYEDGRAVIALAAAEAAGDGAPRVAGDFTDWRPQPMQRAGGEWRFAAPLRPGVYYYAFVAPDGHWYVPRSVAGRRDDGMGGEVAVLVVK